MSNLLEIDNLSIEYGVERGQLQAVKDVNFSIKRGEFFGLAGESGCGKSTIAFSILQLLKGESKVASGEIRFNGQNILAFNRNELRSFRWENASIVLQSAMNNLNPVVTIKSQLIDTIRAHQSVSKSEAVKRTIELLNLVNIDPSRLSSYPHELSGGMRQRVVIAMAMALKPDLVILDEPTTALDVVVQYNIIRKIMELKQTEGFSVLFITHDLPLMLEVCDRIGIMYAGRMAELAEAEHLKKGGTHPYTKGLLKAFPSLLGEKIRLEGIPGSVPDLVTPPPGCLFYDRCTFRTDKCHESVPAFEALSENHYCACHNKSEVSLSHG